MASALQVMSALQQQVQAACAALPGLNVAVGIDFPPIKTLMANVRGGTAVVSVFDRKQTRNTTRWMPIVLGQTITATELVATLSNSTIAAGATETITLSGTITPGDAVSMVMTNRTQPPTEFVTYTRTWATVALVQSGDTLTTLAARLAEQIAADPLLSTWVTATAAGPVVSMVSLLKAGTLGFFSATGNNATQLTEIGRRSRQFDLITWARSIEDRDAVSETIAVMTAQMETFWGNYPAGLTFADGSTGRLTVQNDFDLDDATGSDTYRRDIIVNVDYPVTTADLLYSVLTGPIFQYQMGYPSMPDAPGHSTQYPPAVIIPSSGFSLNFSLADDSQYIAVL